MNHQNPVSINFSECGRRFSVNIPSDIVDLVRNYPNEAGELLKRLIGDALEGANHVR